MTKNVVVGLIVVGAALFVPGVGIGLVSLAAIGVCGQIAIYYAAQTFFLSR